MPDDPTTPPEGEQTGDLADLRKAAKRAGALADENADLRKEIAFRDAGVDLATPMGLFFKDNFKGELDPEVIVAEASKLGVPMKGATPPPDPAAPQQQQTEFSAEEQGSTGERTALHAGSSADEGKVATPNPLDEATRAMEEGKAKGWTEERYLGAGVATIMKAAEAGDSRVLWDPTRDS
ncbi:MAG: hypothetical protein FJ038_03930 [Chloroflexi bacterium]|nr:hypothetical protein [Chloroflexota bacterium]